MMEEALLIQRIVLLDVLAHVLPFFLCTFIFFWSLSMVLFYHSGQIRAARLNG